MSEVCLTSDSANLTALGRGMDVTARKSANVSQFDALLRRRKAASIQAVYAAIHGQDAAAARKRKVVPEDRALLEVQHVTIELDELLDSEGNALGGHGAKCLWSLDLSTLYLELNVTNMTYMKELIRQGQDAHGKSRVAKKRKAPALHSSPNRFRRLKVMAQDALELEETSSAEKPATEDAQIAAAPTIPAEEIGSPLMAEPVEPAGTLECQMAETLEPTQAE